jgi:hypothetical protein
MKILESNLIVVRQFAVAPTLLSFADMELKILLRAENQQSGDEQFEKQWVGLTQPFEQEMFTRRRSTHTPC